MKIDFFSRDTIIVRPEIYNDSNFMPEMAKDEYLELIDSLKSLKMALNNTDLDDLKSFADTRKAGIILSSKTEEF